MGVRAYGNSVVVTIPQEPDNGGIVLPPGADVDRLSRGIVVDSGLTEENGASVHWRVERGEAIFYRSAERIGEELVVHCSDIVAIENDEVEEHHFD